MVAQASTRSRAYIHTQTGIFIASRHFSYLKLERSRFVLANERASKPLRVKIRSPILRVR